MTPRDRTWHADQPHGWSDILKMGLFGLALFAGMLLVFLGLREADGRCETLGVCVAALPLGGVVVGAAMRAARRNR